MLLSVENLTTRLGDFQSAVIHIVGNVFDNLVTRSNVLIILVRIHIGLQNHLILNQRITLQFTTNGITGSEGEERTLQRQNHRIQMSKLLEDLIFGKSVILLENTSENRNFLFVFDSAKANFALRVTNVTTLTLNLSIVHNGFIQRLEEENLLIEGNNIVFRDKLDNVGCLDKVTLENLAGSMNTSSFKDIPHRNVELLIELKRILNGIELGMRTPSIVNTSVKL